MSDLQYIIEADNPDGTHETVERCGWSEEAFHRLRVRAHLEGMRPQGPRRLSVWHLPSATEMASWTPFGA